MKSTESKNAVEYREDCEGNMYADPKPEPKESKDDTIFGKPVDELTLGDLHIEKCFFCGKKTIHPQVHDKLRIVGSNVWKRFERCEGHIGKKAVCFWCIRNIRDLLKEVE